VQVGRHYLVASVCLVYWLTICMSQGRPQGSAGGSTGLAVICRLCVSSVLGRPRAAAAAAVVEGASLQAALQLPLCLLWTCFTGQGLMSYHTSIFSPLDV
jgi:hypothetical protein